MDQQNYTCQAR